VLGISQEDARARQVSHKDNTVAVCNGTTKRSAVSAPTGVEMSSRHAGANEVPGFVRPLIIDAAINGDHVAEPAQLDFQLIPCNGCNHEIFARTAEHIIVSVLARRGSAGWGPASVLGRWHREQAVRNGGGSLCFE
jgi:hypothetical protein